MNILELFDYIKKYPISGYKINNNKAEIHQAELYRDNKIRRVYEKSTLFVTSVNVKKENCIAIGVNSNEDIDCINYIQLSGYIDPQELADELDHIITSKMEDYHNKHISKLFHYLSMNKYLDSLMDDAFKLLQNPIIYYDSLHNVIRHREYPNVTNMGWMKDIELGHHDFSMLRDNFYTDLQAVVKSRNILFTPFENDRCANAAIVSKNNVLGFFAVLEHDRKIKEFDKNTIRFIADTIAIKSYNDNEFGVKDDYSYANLFRELLNGKIQSRQLLSGLLKSRKWKPRKQNRIYVIKDYLEKSYEFISYVKQYLHHVQQNNKVINHEENLIILVEYDKEEDNTILSLPENTKLRVGVSDVFDDLMKMNTYYLQAQRVLEYGAILHKDRQYHFYADYRFIDLVSVMNNNLNISPYIHPIVIEIRDYDRTNNTQYFKTLLAYLTHYKSIEKSSKELGLHKNTVQYRIVRSKELFNIDYDDLEQLFQMLLSLKIIYVTDILRIKDKE